MEQIIEYSEKYLALQKEINQILKDAIARELNYKELKAKVERYEAALKAVQHLEHADIDTMKALVLVSEIVEKALSAGEGEKEAENGE